MPVENTTAKASAKSAVNRRKRLGFVRARVDLVTMAASFVTQIIVFA
jgi:hypothetical protein